MYPCFFVTIVAMTPSDPSTIPPDWRTRLAPTPSGLLHPGNGLAFVLTWALARASNGRLLLRIDDLDKDRCRDEYLEDIFQTLDWLGIDYDEGPSGVADFKQNWSQHSRLHLYRTALDQLRNGGQLFACRCSRRDINAASLDGRYPGTCLYRGLSFEEEHLAWRLRPQGTTATLSLNTWKEGKKTVAYAPDALVLRRKGGLPAYQIGSLVDDVLFRINHIMRGKDLWESTLAQLYLARLLKEKTFSAATFWHHPLLTDEQGQKLSKSKNAGSLKEWRDNGRTPAKLFRLATKYLGLPDELDNGKDLVQLLLEGDTK